MSAIFDYKSSVSILMLAVMLASFALVPFQVKATVPTIDFVAIGKLILQLGELIFQSGQLSALVVKEYVLDPAVKLLASIMLQAITRAIVGWVQSGGNTNFVGNLEAALTRAADEAAGEFLNQLAGTNLCAPFANPIRNTFRVGRPTLSDRLSCTATDIFKNLQTSYEQFLGDFTKGGWLAYNTTLAGGNNYIDALINSYDAKLLAESQRVNVLQAKYQAGGGFIGVNVKKEICDPAIYDPETGDPICTTVDVQTTPGKLVAEQVAHVFNSGIDQAVNADEIAEAIDAIIGALINKLISSAMAGLLSNDSASGIYDVGLGSPAPLPPPPPPPEQAAIKTDIQRISDVISRDIDPALSSINSALPQITAALNRFATSSPSFTDPNVVRLRAIRDQLLTQQAALSLSKDKLRRMKTELETIDRQITDILRNPNQVPVENLAALYSRSRQISQDISAEINDAINPAAGASRDLIAEAVRLIAAVNQLPAT